MKLTLGFSPCPNDTFIFDALVNKKIDTDGLEFEAVLADVETLNQWALEGKLDVTKLSFPAFFRSTEHYLLLDAGSALGKGVGPLFISRGEKAAGLLSDHKAPSIALPGLNTTADLLFSFAYPEALNKKYMVFSSIEDEVLNGQADGGVIIHENRFTYAQKGLFKIKDLGEYWEEKTGLPIPLGGIAVNQSLKRDTALKTELLIRRSLEYAFRNYPLIPDYVKQNAQEMSEEVMRQHISLYVNDYSISLGETGHLAIKKLYDTFRAMHQIEEEEELLFL